MNKYIKFHVKLHKRSYAKLSRRILIFLFPTLFLFAIFLTLSPVYYLYKKIDIPLGLMYPLNIILGTIVSVLGLILYFWTILLFSRVDGTQVPLAPTQKLVVKGPYSIIRNPMVTGAILFVTGLGIILNSILFIAVSMVFPLLYIIYIKLVEEKELETRFGEEYKEYKKSTPFIFPKIRVK